MRALQSQIGPDKRSTGSLHLPKAVREKVRSRLGVRSAAVSEEDTLATIRAVYVFSSVLCASFFPEMVLCPFVLCPFVLCRCACFGACAGSTGSLQFPVPVSVRACVGSPCLLYLA